MKTIIYAVYLPGSEKPDYIGSHLAYPQEDSAVMQWRYTHCTYLGAGLWMDKADGTIPVAPTSARTSRWGAAVLALTPQQRLAIRIETLETAEEHQRQQAEARHIRAHLPPYNKALASGPETKRQKYNAYMRQYIARYRKANPAKLEAKRKADRERLAAKRAQAKAARQQEQNAQPAQAPSTIPADPQHAPNS